MSRSTKILAMLGVSAVAVASGSVAFAQNAGPQPTAGLETVTVTAQRRVENIQKVPIAVTAFSQDKLTTEQVVQTLDLGRLVPDMFAANNVGQASANVYYIRGLGQTQSFPTFEPQVGTYVDDIYISRQNDNNFALFGVQQLQVLNGPQGTLFGRNSTGGAVVVTLQRPGDTFGADFTAGYGSFNGYTLQGAVDVPLSSQILTRTSAYGVWTDGYVDDLTTHQKLNGQNNYGIHEGITILPAGLSGVEWNISGDFERNDAANMLNQPGPDGDRISYTGFSTNPGALEGVVVGNKAGFGQGVVVRSWGAMSNLQWSPGNTALGDGALNIITGYRGMEQDTAVDFALGSGDLPVTDASPVGAIALAQTLRNIEVTQEVKWTAEWNDRFDYTIGGYYLYERNNNNYGQVLASTAIGIPVYFPILLNDQTDINTTNSLAVYAQGDYKLTPDLTATVGVRYTHETKDVTAYPNQPGFGYTTAQIAALYPTTLTANEVTPRFALQYQVDPDLMLFASATEGFQGGGWNGLTGTNPSDFNNFNPETVWSYETGWRYQTPDNRLRFNATAFYENVDHYQLLSDNPHTDSFDTSNAANMWGYGIEGNVAWNPIDPLTISGNFSSMKAQYYDPITLITNQQAACLAGVASAKDSGIVREQCQLATPVYTPALDMTLSGEYVMQFSGFSITPHAGVQFVSREWFDTANTSGYSASWPKVGGEDAPRTLLDLGATFALDNTPLTITAECKNCTMVNYGTADLLGLDYFNYPGTWDVKIGYKF